nr:ATP synthase F0 subunit 8 [Saimiri cassiquiarensis]
MPQLDTSPWPMVILSMIVTLFYITQLKMLNFISHTNPLFKSTKTKEYKTAWKPKWPKTYSPSLMPQ